MSYLVLLPHEHHCKFQNRFRVLDQPLVFMLRIVHRLRDECLGTDPKSSQYVCFFCTDGWHKMYNRTNPQPTGANRQHAFLSDTNIGKSLFLVEISRTLFSSWYLSYLSRLCKDSCRTIQTARISEIDPSLYSCCIQGGQQWRTFRVSNISVLS